MAHEDQPALDIHDIAAYFRHLLERVDWRNDLHFQTRTTIDTLDYSGSGFNQGSKVVIAAAGPKRRDLGTELPPNFSLPSGYRNPKIALPGVLVIESTNIPSGRPQISQFCADMTRQTASLESFPLIVIVEDSEFTARTLNNWLWVTFTRSNPAADIDGIDASTQEKHWGCRGPLVIDARIKPHHAPPLIEDPNVTRRVDQLAAPGGPLHRIF